MAQNLKMIFAKKAAAKKKAQEACPQELKDEPGIYVFVREDEAGIKHAYIGQARRLLSRCGDHFIGYQSIDLSLRKHGICSEDNKHGYSLLIYTYCDIEELDENEKEAILLYSKLGYQLKNKTSGGQGKGKIDLENRKPSKNYRDGLAQGYENARQYIKALFYKYLDASPKNPVNKIKIRKYMEFKDWLEGENK